MIYTIFGFYLLTRLAPYLYSSVPLGYDPGLYLYLFNSYSSVGLFEYTKLANWLVEVYPPLLPFVVRIINIFVSPENILVPLALLAAASLYAATYYLVNHLYGKKTALVTLAILSLSIIQFKFYWWYYVKNIFAVALTLLLIALMNKKSKWAYAVAPAIVLLHQPTAIVAMMVLLLRKHDKQSLLTIAASALAFVAYYVPNWDVTIAPYLPGFMRSLTPASYGTESGTFYSLAESFWYMLPYLPLSIAALLNSKVKKDKSVMVLMLTSLVFAGGVFLSRRFVPILDISLIILAGAMLATFNKKIIVGYLILLAIFFAVKLPEQAKPLINMDEYNEIQLLSTTESDASILVADNEYTPWIYGYSKRRAIAPGFGENDVYWNASEWEDFWSSNNRAREMELLNKLPKPIYIYLGDKQRMILFRPDGECFTKFSLHTYKYICK
jgi:hypothetical protein